MLRTITFLILFFIIQRNTAQSLISSGGDYFAIANGSLSWSLGEVITETFTKSTFILTQGFQQNMLAPVGIVAHKTPQNSEVIVFPNPATESIQIEFDTQSSSGPYPNHLALFDLQGKIIIDQPILDSPHTLEISNLRGAVYYLRLYHTEFDFCQTLVIQKN